ncbi:hypothetical protein [Sandaracinus amylolyticus]|uniref:Uncharacterized protein n=1 Tax=Sandaracinus amylolyticus TaxID=927083 RepID=A0A0F6YK35_9BACT|nr:hypothetical protein [Sandaracinus amylolyticus]AKF07888.1 hypothetical protein DB32_005037 [Sandaracinus amylolyticus]UJR79501.1 Hypothetical protein I5071_15370 [Sandaracinus amylolyticus]
MGRTLRDGSGALLVGVAMAALFFGVVQLRAHDYVAAVLLVIVALSVLRAGVELLRPTLGE